MQIRLKKIHTAVLIISTLVIGCSHSFDGGDRKFASAVDGASERADESAVAGATTQTPPATPAADEGLILAQSGFERNSEWACAYSANLLAALEEVKPEELRSSFRKMAVETQALIDKTETKNAEDRETLRMRKQLLGDYETLAAETNPHTRVRETLGALCKTSRSVGGAIIRSTSTAMTALTSVILLPLRFVVKAGVGIWTQRRTPEMGPTYYDLMPSAGDLSGLTTVAYQTARVAFFSGSPLTLAAYGVLSFDEITEKFCKSELKFNTREKRFCDRFASIRKNAFELSEEGEKIGIKLGDKILLAFDRRDDDELNSDLCSMPVQKQFRIAERARKRLRALTRKELKIELWDGHENGFPKAVINSPDEHGCMSLKVVAESDEMSKKLGKHLPSIVDGFAVSLAVATPAQLAQPRLDPTFAPLTEPEGSEAEAVCKMIDELKTERVFGGEFKWRSASDQVQLLLNPAKFSGLNLKTYETDATLLKREPLNQLGTGKNYILVLAPTDEQVAEYELVKGKLKDLQKKYQEQAKHLRKLVKSKSHNACISRQEKFKFNPREFEQMSKSLHEFQSVDRVTQFKVMSKQVKHAGRFLWVFNKLKLDWDILPLKDFNELRDIIRKPDTRNVLIVSHGDSTGKFIDAEMNHFPATGFVDLSPSIQSISLFGCHSEFGIEKSLKMEESYKVNPTFSKIRYFGGDRSSGAILGSENESLVAALSNYVERLDRELHSATEGNLRFQEVYGPSLPEKVTLDSSSCSLKFDGLKVGVGAFAVKINQKFAGMTYRNYEKNPRSFDFPCNWLKTDSSNSVMLENINLLEKSAVQSDAVTLTVNRPGQPEVNLKTINVCHRSTDQSISCLKYKF